MSGWEERRGGCSVVFILMAEPVAAVLSREFVLRIMIAIFMTSAVYFLSVRVTK